MDNDAMPQDAWRARIERAEELAQKHAFAAEVLRFYGFIARFQGELFSRLSDRTAELPANCSPSGELPNWLLGGPFQQFLARLRNHAPAKVADRARSLENGPAEVRMLLLNNFWNGLHPQRQEVDEFIARSYLQPYAGFLRGRAEFPQAKHTSTLCPFCGRRPGVGVLRPLGEGGQRSLICSLCLAEWPFRRILCPGCGEENHEKLPVFTAAELAHVRVEGCDSCKTYLKTVDLTRYGLAEPVVDEIAAVPLDLWAQEHGYTKLQANLMQI
jgi:FdhE protein